MTRQNQTPVITGWAYQWVDHDGRLLAAGTREHCEKTRAEYESTCRAKGVVPAVTYLRRAA
jgi:hypothetical protein